MKVDIPEFKKCCCCIPLRPGLLGLGYIKLLASLVFLGFLTYISILVLLMPVLTSEILVLLVFILLVMVEIFLTVVFLLGAHKKNHKYIRIYYYYSIIVLGLYVLAFIVTMTLDIVYHWPYVMQKNPYIGTTVLQTKISTGLLNAVIQLYVIFLIRSEVMKLKTNMKFRFSNQAAAESQCQMESDDVKYQNNVIQNEPKLKELDVDAMKEKDMVDKKNNKNINDTKLYLNKYIKMTNEE